ncbi:MULTISPECIES: Clp protease N-terminal domain-containing protein [Catenuloplanes]|uniref:ATP-dependent Clp protease ATP-binding subunit ClpA n=1 Tax=Catenuloplanes niger TaxID=587534 RepID=A0AAE3ZNT3_9ACTN|nr:Clp protease N-terminal domain-containing protein [Catenuloplanes niger]MDR7322146.1 ATP-dependent Clp protease ATP-binding subunit ClpA [Catenuloplanes niger]
MSVVVGGGLYRVLQGACRVAADLNQLAIGTDTVFVALLNAFPNIASLVGPRPVRVTGYDLHQGVEAAAVDLVPEVEIELGRALKEVHWRVFGWVRDGTPSNVPSWTNGARSVLRLAMAIAASRRDSWVGADHLLEALMADQEGVPARLIRQRGVNLDHLTTVARQVWPTPGGEPPRRALAELMHRAGVLVSPGQENRAMGALTRHLTSGVVHLLTNASPALAFLEDEAIAETVRSGWPQTTSAHLLLAVVVLEEEMMAGDFYPSDNYLSACGIVLKSIGFDRGKAYRYLESVMREEQSASPQRRRAWRSNPKNPPWTITAVRVADSARGVGSAPVGSAHLLYSILVDSDDIGRRLLREQAIDPQDVRVSLARRLALGNSEA